MRKIIYKQYLLAILWVFILYIPTIYALSSSIISDRYFSGSIVNIHDHNAYLSSVQDGMNGEVWLGNLLFTTESDLPQGLHHIHASLFYRILGWIYGLIGLPINLFYIVIGSIFAFIAFIGYCKLFNACFSSKRELTVAMILLFVFPGVLWINQLMQQIPDNTTYFPNHILFAELWGNPSMNPLTHNSYMPHFVFATATSSILFCSLLEVVHSKSSNYLRIAISSLLVAWLLPTLGILWIAISFTYILYNRLYFGLSNSRIKLLSISFVPAVILSLWSSHLAFLDEFWVKYIYTNVVMNGTIDLALFILHLGIFSIVVAWSMFELAKNHTNNSGGTVLAAIWLFWLFIISLASFPGSPRFMDGIYLPVIILVTYAYSNIRNTKPALLRWFNLTIIVAVLPGTILTYIYPWYGHLYVHFFETRLNLLSDEIWPIHLSKSEANTLYWLKDNVDDSDVVISGPIMSSFVPAFSGSRVYFGHIGRTVDFHRKLDELQTLKDTKRLTLLELDGDLWLVSTPKEPIDSPNRLYVGQINYYCATDSILMDDVSVVQYQWCD